MQSRTEQAASTSPNTPTTPPDTPAFASDAERVAAFGKALEAVKAEIKNEMGHSDTEYVLGVARLSRRLEFIGRGLIHISLDPLTFGVGTTTLWAHKCLELMELGHMALHGSFDKLEGAERYHANNFRWKAPVDERSWRQSHNVRHHKYTNVEGSDPDMSYGSFRLSERIPFKMQHMLQPFTNLLTWLSFGNAINMHATGMLSQFTSPVDMVFMIHGDTKARRTARSAFARKFMRYHVREYIVFPALAGPFFWKTLLGNALSELGRDLYAGAIIYSGHIGAVDYPAGTRPKGQAQWYHMQAEAARNVKMPHLFSVLGGALDRQIEHHLFPAMPPNRLRQISPRIKAICEAHGVRYLEESWPRTLADIFGELRKLGRKPSPQATPTPAPATTGAPATAQA